MLQRICNSVAHTLQLFVYANLVDAMRNSWTDDRLDALNHRVDDGFKQVDERFKQVDQRFDQVDQRFDRMEGELHRINDRFDALQKTMTQSSALVIVALIGLIATQL